MIDQYRSGREARSSGGGTDRSPLGPPRAPAETERSRGPCATRIAMQSLASPASSAALVAPDAACEAASSASKALICKICMATTQVVPAEIPQVRVNIRSLRDQRFRVWRCTACESLHTYESVDLDR